MRHACKGLLLLTLLTLLLTPTGCGLLNRRALMRAAADGDTAAVQALLDKGVDVNETNTTDGSTALMMAALAGHTETAQVLLDAGADVNAEVAGRTDSEDGYTTALMMAAGEGHTSTVQALVDAGADVNAKVVGRTDSLEGQTALLFAALNGYTTIIQALIDAGADTNATAAEPSRPRLSTSCLLDSWTMPCSTFWQNWTRKRQRFLKQAPAAFR